MAKRKNKNQISVAPATATMIATIFECIECGATWDESSVGDALYECSECGDRFDRENSADGSGHRCPSCNKFGFKVADFCCPECQGEVEECEQSGNGDVKMIAVEASAVTDSAQAEVAATPSANETLQASVEMDSVRKTNREALPSKLTQDQRSSTGPTKVAATKELTGNDVACETTASFNPIDLMNGVIQDTSIISKVTRTAINEAICATDSSGPPLLAQVPVQVTTENSLTEQDEPQEPALEIPMRRVQKPVAILNAGTQSVLEKDSTLGGIPPEVEPDARIPAIIASVNKRSHPLAQIMPMMSVSELMALADDIKAKTLLAPIVMLAGLILDGRNRLVACILADVEPGYVEFESLGSTVPPVEWIISQNIQRRHLTIGQRAMVGAMLILELERDARTRQGARTDLHSDREIDCGRSADKAAKAVGVSSDSIKAATRVLRLGVPEVQQALMSGEISLNAAVGTLDSKTEAHNEGGEDSKPRGGDDGASDPEEKVGGTSNADTTTDMDGPEPSSTCVAESTVDSDKTTRKGRSRTITSIKDTIPTFIPPCAVETPDGFVAKLSRNKWGSQIVAMQVDPKIFVQMLERTLHLSFEAEDAK